MKKVEKTIERTDTIVEWVAADGTAFTAEDEWHKDNGEVWSEYDEEWYPKDEVVVIHYNNGTSETISRESLGGFDCEERDGEFYEMEEIEVEQEVNA